MHAHAVHSRVYNVLFSNFTWFHRKPWRTRLWTWAVRYFLKKNIPVNTRLHGHSVLINSGCMYPYYSRAIDTYNNPLVELLYQTYKEKQRKITVIDVGAGVGDTYFLMLSNLPDAIDQAVCIEGSEFFFSFLRQNLQKYSGTYALQVLLAGEAEADIKTLVYTHSGTASALGSSYTRACTLDAVIDSLALRHVDMIKIDVDGYDGNVIAGAKETLLMYKPTIIFEYHPLAIARCSNDVYLAFRTLEECNYNRYIWFDKYGRFSHFDTCNNRDSLQYISRLCINNNHHNDWHYDIVALHMSSLIDPVTLAEMSFAKNMKSRY